MDSGTTASSAKVSEAGFMWPNGGTGAREPREDGIASSDKGRSKSAIRWLARALAGDVRVSALLLILLLAGLPLSVWMDMRTLSERGLHIQADTFVSVIDSIRGYYASNVVGRVLANHGETTEVVHDYLAKPGAIPIPATLSLELSDVVSGSNGNIDYRFFSDYPFKSRAPHPFDAFERDALDKLRQDPGLRLYQAGGSIFDREIRLVMPIRMASDCVACHNTHPDSPKRDWKVGDVRGIEEITVRQPIAGNIWAFKYLLAYFVLASVIGLAFLGSQRYQSSVIQRVNQELGRANEFLASVSRKIAKYLSPQHYNSIFSGQKDAVITTERKKLTIFFSDIVGFTSTAERLQPEEFTALLNEYLTEMSLIASKHGGTVNKFIGDAILIFFGDLESHGVEEDAKACLRMAFEMQRRLVELNGEWRRRGVDHPFQARMGINTGFCNVGNFGSSDRMDYTIIGSEANLAARLQSIAKPGSIILSYETYTLVRSLALAHPLEPITLKGITHPVVPYEVEGSIEETGDGKVISEQGAGVDIYIDLTALDESSSVRLRALLGQTIDALDREARRASATPDAI